ncbi:MAG: hypothetical protein R2939_02905 [Kofleriaceae bacterium]
MPGLRAAAATRLAARYVAARLAQLGQVDAELSPQRREVRRRAPMHRRTPARGVTTTRMRRIRFEELQ